jgi:hypothetical protein
MEPQRFDDLTRALVDGTSRRHLLRLLFGGRLTASGAGAEPVTGWPGTRTPSPDSVFSRRGALRVLTSGLLGIALAGLLPKRASAQVYGGTCERPDNGIRGGCDSRPNNPQVCCQIGPREYLCLDPRRDTCCPVGTITNCSYCGDICAGGKVCINRRCQCPPCPIGQAPDSNCNCRCTDDRGCGTCESCFNGVCIPQGNGATCGSFSVCCNGRCVSSSPTIGPCSQRIPRQGFIPEVNGCGPNGFGPFIPDCWVWCGRQICFTQDCNAHDACYGTCNSNRYGCDFQLIEAMKARCHATFFDRPQCLHSCIQRSYQYFEAVASGGLNPYIRAQRAACTCCGPCERSDGTRCIAM